MNTKENIPLDNPRRAPPTTSVVQCSPRLTLDISITTSNTKSTKEKKILVFNFDFDFLIK